VIAISRGLGEQLVDTLGIARDHVRVIYNPTVEEDLAARGK